MSSKRHLQRKSLVFYCEVFDRKTGLLIGRMNDLNEEGIMLLGSSPLEVKKLYEVKVVFPFELAGKTELELDAQCLRCQQDINPDLWDIGFRLERMTPLKRKLLEALIERLAIDEQVSDY
ncbi:MAG: hypothetical protein A2527_09115 [Candidatus Lambdaproteobacteria bacterium RIFOXYD2_FULL_50_16]|uniref:PilZ domain-containing protein n=1 Tax=Candidatus Lambdaproteobacteria bacterium RIFOXYD2_FULL_50_16 TaxID=1817772 RepID=A0A1F6G7C3_9PROT|nr:MAG: hypothetical protein A2527_09115 [Candidatus Lambdaproteobacteria bacterium RIFOXYD2_FULL_50_16]